MEATRRLSLHEAPKLMVVQAKQFEIGTDDPRKLEGRVRYAAAAPAAAREWCWSSARVCLLLQELDTFWDAVMPSMVRNAVRFLMWNL